MWPPPWRAHIGGLGRGAPGNGGARAARPTAPRGAPGGAPPGPGWPGAPALQPAPPRGWPAGGRSCFFFAGPRAKETSQGFYFAGSAGQGTSQVFIFAGQGPASEDPLRIPSGVEAIPVKSGQQETSQDFFGPAPKNFLTCLDRGGARLPGDRA